MKFKFQFLSVILSLIVLTGCATGPSFQEQSASIPTASPDSARIYVYRTAVLGAAIQPAVKVNDEIVGKAVPKGFFYIDRPAGNYTISASTEAKRNLTIALEPGDERYVRLEVKIGLLVAQVKPVLVENSIGQQQIAGTKYVGQ